MVTVLGIESTAHTFGVGIVKNGKILANVKQSYTTKKGGIIPIDAAKHHAKYKTEIYNKALEEAGIEKTEINAIAFSQGPGLAPCLLVGLKKAKDLAKESKLSLVPVNHCVAHLEIGKITGAKDPVMLYASGANTQIIAYAENSSKGIRKCRKVCQEPCNASGKYRIFGETLDIGVGNFVDNFARFAGIGFPGGPAIEKLARNGKKYIDLPYTVKGMDIALSGILTNLRQKLEKINITPPPTPTSPLLNLEIRNKINANNKKNFSVNNKKSRVDKRVNYKIEDLAFSMQETVFAMLVETAERALAHTGKKELLLGGGVACNSRLQEMCKIMCKERGAKFFCPPNSLLTDNGAMIAFLGEIMLNSGIKFSCEELDEIDIQPRQRTDEVEVNWR